MDSEEWAKRVSMARKEVYALMGIGPLGCCVPTQRLIEEAEKRGMWAHVALLREYMKHNS